MQVEWKQPLDLGQVWGGVCGILKKAMGRADRKDYGQESNRGAWEGERIWRTEVGWSGEAGGTGSGI